MDKIISIKEAKEISIAKWERKLFDFNELMYDEYNKKLTEFHNKYPSLRNHFSCGFCYRHGVNFETTHKLNNCKNCELGKTEAKICIEDGSLYDFIEESGEDEDTIKDAIEQLIRIIKEIPDEE